VSFVGRWRIVAMDLWGPEDVDLVQPGFVEFGKNQTGSFGFLAVEGGIDWREAARDGQPGVEFAWEGYDEGDPASGRGWAVLDDDGSLRGHIFFHLGDDSGFQAVPDDSSHTRVERRRGGSR